MAQQCSPNEYFDRLLNACKPCVLRCPNAPPLTCQRYCNAMKGTNAILWTCLGLSLMVSLTVFVLMFLLRKMNSESLKDEFKKTGPIPQCLQGLRGQQMKVVCQVEAPAIEEPTPYLKETGSALQNEADADLDDGRIGAEVILPRGLEYTVEECTCEDCVKSKPKVDSDHLFPLPAMEEGATILVTTKTNDYCNGLPLAVSVTGMEKSIYTR